jgi:hypothetical protein
MPNGFYHDGVYVLLHHWVEHIERGEDYMERQRTIVNVLRLSLCLCKIGCMYPKEFLKELEALLLGQFLYC